MSQLDILYEDNHLLAINKPAGLPTMGAGENQPTLLLAAKEYLRRAYGKPGNVYLGIVSRLDAPVSGVILFARTSKAAARLTRAFQNRDVVKRYWALVSPARLDAQGMLTHHLRKDEARRRMAICPPQHAAAQEARLRYVRCASTEDFDWVEVDLLTGRKHQIRVQLEATRSPILGDVRYGSPHPFPHGIALHSRELQLEHPVRRQPLSITAKTPVYWPRLPRRQDAVSLPSEADRGVSDRE